MKVLRRRMSPPYILSRYITLNSTFYCSLTFFILHFQTFAFNKVLINIYLNSFALIAFILFISF